LASSPSLTHPHWFCPRHPLALAVYRPSPTRTPLSLSFFFFNAPAPTEIYTLSLHDALPICHVQGTEDRANARVIAAMVPLAQMRSEEHTSELQSHLNLVCRLLLEKKKKQRTDRRDIVITPARRNRRDTRDATAWSRPEESCR